MLETLRNAFSTRVCAHDEATTLALPSNKHQHPIPSINTPAPPHLPFSMRQRITYLLPRGTGVDPADISAGKDDLTFRQATTAAVERRITLGLSELPLPVSGMTSYREHEVESGVVRCKNSSRTFTNCMSG